MLTMLMLAAYPQTGTLTDTLAGTVQGPGGQPLAGAIVHVTSAVTGLSRWQTTDVGGRFTICFPGRAHYQLTAHYFGLVPARGIESWGHQDGGAASIRLELAGIANPIDTILTAYGVLGLTSDQITRLRDIAASTDSFGLPELERVRNVLTVAQWTRLSTERLVAPAVRAQPVAATATAAPRAPAQAPAQVPVRRPRNLTLYTGVSTVYETNLNHTPTPLDSYGMLLGAGADFRGRWSNTTLAVDYDGVYRHYTSVDLWNVPGHQGSVAIEQRVTKRWALGGEAGVQLNGSSEDRVLRNEYTAQADLNYRPRGVGRWQLYFEYMVKRYPAGLTTRNSTDPRVGIKYRRVLGKSGTWGIGGRYNYNSADSSRYTYRAWTATTDLGVPVGSALVSATFRYNVRQYTHRLVTVGTGEELRRDADNVATLALTQRIKGTWDVVASYRFEHYGSNDPDKRWRADMVAVALTRYW